MNRLSNIAAAVSLFGAATVALASDFAGRSLEEVISALEERGLSILYSSDLVKPEMRVEKAPSASEPRPLLEEIVRPHGIAVADGPGGSLVLTRARRAEPSSSSALAAPAISEVVVTASRYEWVREPQTSLTRLSDAELSLAPNVGDDPLRTLARLPGTAGSDYSAKLNIRGGVSDEVLVRFDGLRLVNPFHLKDFQSLFSAINPALVGAVDVYTGGFPVYFGDRMSGVIDIHPLRAEAPLRREIAASLYNVSAFGAGRFDDGRGDWSASARRGNLDRVLKWTGTKLGEPVYSDIYGHVGHRIGESMALSANVLRFDDDIELADSDAEEQARARYRDRYLWLRFDAHPHESLVGSSIVARTDIESVRTGTAEQPGISRGMLVDRREFAIEAMQTEWSWRTADAVAIQFGGEWRRSRGRYRYVDEAEFDLAFEVPAAAAESGRRHRIEHRSTGSQYGAYASLRAEIVPPFTLEGGVRWDRSTLSTDGGHVSPRASALYRMNNSALVRASWGRFVQTQSIDELPVSDGMVEYFPAQHADHWLVGFEHRIGEHLGLRIEAYRKQYSDLRPRFENLLNNVVILPELKPDRVRIAPTSARAHGAELSLRSVRPRPLFWWVSYTWSQAEDVFAGRTVRRAWDQRHALSVGIGWEREPWELSFAGAWRSGWPSPALVLVADGDEVVVRVDSADERRFGAYLDIDARVGRTFRFEDGSSLTAFFEISNVLNRRNECCIEYELDDESGRPELVLESIRSLPLLPSLGVVWRF